MADNDRFEKKFIHMCKSDGIVQQIVFGEISYLLMATLRWQQLWWDEAKTQQRTVVRGMLLMDERHNLIL